VIATGTKFTVIVHVPIAAMLLQLVDATVKSGEPLIVLPLYVTAEVDVLVIVTDSELPVDPTTVFGNVNEVADSVTVSGEFVTERVLLLLQPARQQTTAEMVTNR
jgi:hypothetical protein